MESQPEKESSQSDKGHPKRRNLLKATAAGIAGTGISSARDVPTVEVPRFLGRDGVKEWMEVPASWKRHLDSVKSKKEQLVTNLSEKPGRYRVGIIASCEGETYGGKRGFQLRVETEETHFHHVPDEAGGISVATEQLGDYAPACGTCSECGVNQCHWPDTPGGASIMATYDEKTNYATASCWVEKSGERQLLTAAHIGGSYNPKENSPDYELDIGDNIYQGKLYYDSLGWIHRKIGEVTEFDQDADYMLIDNSSEYTHNPTDDIVDQSGNAKTVNGVADQHAIADICCGGGLDGCDDICDSDDRKVYKSGITSGVTDGWVKAFGLTRTDQITHEGHGVEFSTFLADGDSGAPVYIDNGSWVYLVASITGGDLHDTNICDDARVHYPGIGTASYHLRSKYNLTYDLDLSNDPRCDSNTCDTDCDNWKIYTP
ncbi:MAG: hypothetical protein ABEJ42_02505 [Halobacteriaceae archaeon]